MSGALLTPAQQATFVEDGLLVVPGFYDVAGDIEPIQRAIHAVIGKVMQRHGLADSRKPFAAADFDDGYRQLIAADRRIGGEVYDAVKQIPAFVRLLGNARNEALFRELRPGALPGIAAGGSGIRIDNPGEDRYRAEWHQEYPSQLRSLDGIVFWSPLVEITPELGPVRFCPGSHREGALPVTTGGAGERSGAYALRLKDEAAVLARHREITPLARPGDLIAVDFLTLHASGFNRSGRSRWSLQFRYFNFAEPTGMRHGWKGSFAAGVDFREIHPELCADGDANG